jgi:hypothetical protein
MLRVLAVVGDMVRIVAGTRRRNECDSDDMRRFRCRASRGPCRTKTVDLKQINRVLLQPHWRKEVDLPQ